MGLSGITRPPPERRTGQSNGRNPIGPPSGGIPMPERLVVVLIAQHATTGGAALTQICADPASGTQAMARSARSVLKMKRLIRPGHAFLRSRACGCRQASRGNSRQRRRGPASARLMDQFEIRSAIHSHGFAPDRMSRAVSSCRARSCGEPTRANTAARCVERVLEGGREQRIGIGCRQSVCVMPRRVLEERPARLLESRGACTTREIACGSSTRGDDQADSRIGA